MLRPLKTQETVSSKLGFEVKITKNTSVGKLHVALMHSDCELNRAFTNCVETDEANTS